MEKDCTHDCSTCGETCDERTDEKVDFSAKLNEHSSVKKVIGVISGKGGVGKSIVTA
nr:ATP-binding protein [Bacilli bacterium]